ncbi:hypothetical protein [Nonomuraea sp. NPDC052265]|uniref:hypothetical protein n=1 Tax=Nonomuraea sp. NPDC052265 TaxID=3364374 RepID=UPI0037C80B43
MYLVTRYLQLVEGLTPFDAGLWMGPPALAMFAAAIGGPLVARRFRPGSVMGAALTSVADAYTARIRDIIDTPGDKLNGLAHLIAESAGPGRERALAEREPATLAARRSALRPVARRWRENIAELATTLTDDPAAIAALVAASDGLCTALLLDNAPADPDHIQAVLQRAVRN